MPSQAYSLYVYYPSRMRSTGLEDQIEAAMGKASSGGGTDFEERDIDFYFDDEDLAKAGIVSISKFMPEGTKVALFHYPDLEQYHSIDIISKTSIGLVVADIQANQINDHTPRPKGATARRGL